jgi:CheY-like chemotaxis protein
MKKILCIEDDFNSQLLLKMCFRRTEYDSTIVSNGERALALLEEQTFDLVLSDWNLNGKLTADALIHSLYTYTNKTNTPLLVVSADHSLIKGEMVAPEMVARILYKPIIKSELIKQLSDILKLSTTSIL